MTRKNKLAGCYRRVLIFLSITVAILLAGGLIGYQRIGGVDGARYWMAGQALKQVEKQILKNRPDGVAEAEVESRFEKVGEANKNRRTDLLRLDGVFRNYQYRFKKTKPSTGELVKFLTDLEATIIPEDTE